MVFGLIKGTFRFENILLAVGVLGILLIGLTLLTVADGDTTLTTLALGNFVAVGLLTAYSVINDMG